MTALALVSTLAIAGSPGGVIGIEHAQHVTLEVPYTYDWTAQRPQVTEVTAVVVRVADPDVLGRQVGPVLYVGDTPAQIVNNGRGCACVVAVVPGHLDLGSTPVFFGSETPPGRVDASYGAGQLAVAVGSGVQPLAGVTEVTRPAARVHDDVRLYALLADLVDLHAPDEEDRAANLRRPAGG